MEKEIIELIEISHYYGKNKGFVIAGGGNTSYKNDDKLWVKASGTSLSDITENGFAVLDRKKLSKIADKEYSKDAFEREKQIMTDLMSSHVVEENKLRPSVESSLHNIWPFKFVVHTHPTLLNSLLCSVKCETLISDFFDPAEFIYVPYTDPGYILFTEVVKKIQNNKSANRKIPNILFLQNHGVFVGADTTDEIKTIYNKIEEILKKIVRKFEIESLPINTKAAFVLPALRMLLSEDATKILRIKNNNLISQFSQSQCDFQHVALPFTPDNIVYCKARPMYIENSGTPDEIIEDFSLQLAGYRQKFGFDPKIILIKDLGLIAAEDSSVSVDILHEVFEDLMKISYYSNFFGGPRFMSKNEINFIESWEVENYRRKVSRGSIIGQLSQKIVVVTGAAQGFGVGIANSIFSEKSNLVVADINEHEGNKACDSINTLSEKNKAIFIKTDVSDPDSVKNLIYQTVYNFGGLDVFISNAGILRAGGLDEMSPGVFDLVTLVNYNAYFYCVKYASEIMRIQNKYCKEYFADIIQINSKSGLRGSNKNFAYAGGKFGGIGLTQSFALELMPFKIKVNSICPGNFYEGPLWSDPDNGLFVQYLKTGKVPGAKTIEDVKKFYEAQVPAGRGCRVADVMKAILYAIGQEYETGQAIPVTGGQIMLN